MPLLLIGYSSRDMIKPTKWSESSQCAQWVAKDPSFLHADSEDSDQTGRMPRLIWVFAESTLILLVLSCHGSFDETWRRKWWKIGRVSILIIFLYNKENYNFCSLHYQIKWHWKNDYCYLYKNGTKHTTKCKQKINKYLPIIVCIGTVCWTDVEIDSWWFGKKPFWSLST